MPNQEKIDRVAELQRRIEGSAALLLAEYRGLTVSDISELRRALQEVDASFSVIKNTLMARAAVDAGIEELESFLSGPSAVSFVGGDPVAAAKKIKAAGKLHPALVLKGGYMDGQVLSAEDAGRLADLDSREEMLSKIAGLLKGEMSRAAAVFISAQSKFLSLLEAYKEKVPGDPEPPAEASVASSSGDDSAADEGGADADGSSASEPPADDAPDAQEADHAPEAEAAASPEDGDAGATNTDTTEASEPEATTEDEE